MGPTAVDLTGGASINLTRVERTITAGMSPTVAPQAFGVSATYSYGNLVDLEEFQMDMPIFIPITLNGGDVRVINLPAGSEVDPTGYTPARIAWLKELFICVARVNPDDDTDTAADGVSVAFNASMMTALGASTGAMTRTMLRGQRIQEGYPLGRSTGADASITITNLSATDKTTVYVALAGFKP